MFVTSGSNGTVGKDAWADNQFQGNSVNSVNQSCLTKQIKYVGHDSWRGQPDDPDFQQNNLICCCKYIKFQIKQNKNYPRNLNHGTMMRKPI